VLRSSVREEQEAKVRTARTAAPDRTEASEYYFTYIDQVSRGDICEILDDQLHETLALLEGISEERAASIVRSPVSTRMSPSVHFIESWAEEQSWTSMTE
jgi:hypothetical protein